MPPKRDREFTIRLSDYGRCKSDEEFLALKRLGYAEAKEIFAEEGIFFGDEVTSEHSLPSDPQPSFALPTALFADSCRGKIGIG